MTSNDVYDPNFVRSLFDEMAQTYGFVNLVSSFGFAWLWRRQCLHSIDIERSSTVLDLMTGMGELGPDLTRILGSEGKIIAVDISSEMCQRASKQVHGRPRPTMNVIEANALNCPLDDNSVDYVVSTFGLKTFNREQLQQLAQEVKRVLRPGGQFAFLEISVPRTRILRWPYLFYINHVIPLLGRAALGNPENYRLLGRYTIAFEDCRYAHACFSEAELDVSYLSYFFGCATGLTGRKPT